MLHWLKASVWPPLIGAVVSVLSVPTTAQDRIVLVGSGSNLAVYLYQAWTREFNASNNHVQIQYLPVGTSDGLRQVSAGIGDFGAGEIPLSDEQMHASGIPLVPIPEALVGIVPIYNLPGRPQLNFSGELLAEMYLGRVKNWKDPQIAKLNPTAALPDMPIHIVHRGPGRGSNFIFTNFLSKTSPRFRDAIGRSASPRWPTGVEAYRGQDMLQKVSATKGAMGYVDLSFLRNASVGRGRVENASGQFVVASPETLKAACAAAENSSPADFSVDLTNAPGRDSYPLASLTWIYVPVTRAHLARSRALKEFLTWSLQDGQKLVQATGYAPLPAAIALKALAVVKSLP